MRHYNVCSSWPQWLGQGIMGLNCRQVVHWENSLTIRLLWCWKSVGWNSYLSDLLSKTVWQYLLPPQDWRELHTLKALSPSWSFCWCLLPVPGEANSHYKNQCKPGCFTDRHIQNPNPITPRVPPCPQGIFFRGIKTDLATEYVSSTI